MSDDYSKFVKKAIAGDKNAFAELYNLFLDRIYRFIYYLVEDEFLAEDITQITFVKAWNKIGMFSITKGTFQSYLYTIARNLVIDHQRKKKEISLELTIGENFKSDTNLEQNVLRNESMTKVRQSLSVLDEDDRQIIILRYFEDMSFKEIAAITSKKSGAIRVKVHRLLGILRKKLEGKI
jgi:RNA polymerase sigma-70 factor (ECF subfamily)